VRSAFRGKDAGRPLEVLAFETIATAILIAAYDAGLVKPSPSV
jgi:hypothetical protein